MTILVLDPPEGALPPYPAWLREAGADLVLFTARPRTQLGDTSAYADVRTFARYRSSGLLEREAVRLAATTPLSAIVALAPADAIRAGALRDLLGVAGRGRDDAIVLGDLVALRRRLELAGVPTLAWGAVQRVSDVYWYGHRWGYPLRVRARRTPGWPAAAELGDEAAVRAFTRGGLSPKLERVPSLLAEPCLDGARHVVIAGDASPAGAAAVVRAAVDALPAGTGGWRAELLCTPGGAWLIDTIAPSGRSRRALARAQAGLEYVPA